MDVFTVNPVEAEEVQDDDRQSEGNAAETHQVDDLIASLSAPDSVMEKQAPMLIPSGHGASSDHEEAIRGIVCRSYEGSAARANTVLEWLASTEGQDASHIATYDQLEQLLMKSFDTEAADSIFSQKNPENPMWISGMLRYPRWRQMFCALSEQHRGCLLLSFIIHRICEMGPVQRNEVAARAPASAAAVRTVSFFRDLLTGVLAPLCRADANEATFQKVMPTVVRMCSQNPQVYLYALAVFARAAMHWEDVCLQPRGNDDDDEGGQPEGSEPDSKRRRTSEEPKRDVARANAAATRRMMEELAHYTAVSQADASAMLPKRIAMLVQWFGVPSFCAHPNTGVPNAEAHGYADVLAALSHMIARGETNPHDMQRVCRAYVGSLDDEGPQHTCRFPVDEKDSVTSDEVMDHGSGSVPQPPLLLIRTASFIEMVIVDLCRPTRPVTPVHRLQYLHLLAIAAAAEGSSGGFYSDEPEVVETFNTLQLADNECRTGHHLNLPDLEPLVIQYPMVAAYVVEWLRVQMTDMSSGATALSVQETPRRMNLLMGASRQHPLLRPKILEAIFAAFTAHPDAKRPADLAADASVDSEIAATALLSESGAAGSGGAVAGRTGDESTYGINVQVSEELLLLEVKRHLVDGLVQLIRAGVVIPTIEGFIDVTTCPVHHCSLGTGLGVRTPLSWLAERSIECMSGQTFTQTPRRLVHAMPAKCQCDGRVDDSLIRYFVTEVLAAAAPPYSQAFCKSMVCLSSSHHSALLVSRANTAARGRLGLSLSATTDRARASTDGLVREFGDYVTKHAKDLQLQRGVWSDAIQSMGVS